MVPTGLAFAAISYVCPYLSTSFLADEAGIPKEADGCPSDTTGVTGAASALLLVSNTVLML